MPTFHKQTEQTEVGDRLAAELSGQRTEGRPPLKPLSLHASEIEATISDNALVKLGRTAFAPRFNEIKESDLTLCTCQLKGKQFWLSAIEVNDEQLPLSIKTEYGAGKWHTTRQHEQKGRIQLDLD